jgi:hypothetical protein
MNLCGHDVGGGFKRNLELNTGSSGRIYFLAEGTDLGVAGTNVNNGSWHNIVITHSATHEVKIYMDNTLRATGTVGAGAAAANTFYLGRRAFDTEMMFNGLMDEVSIWNAVLTADQVTEIWNSGVPGNLANHSIATNSLQAWWRFSGNFDDSSGKIKNLSQFNNPSFSTDVKV